MSNNQLAIQVLEEAIRKGVREFCLCPGSRNSPLVMTLIKAEDLKKYYWYEERSAAFFALGRARATGQPVAVVTTSGTAVGELLPATMEAYYTGVPLLLFTADRPRRFRGTGAPQSAEQVGIFSHYTIHAQDLAAGDHCSLNNWSQKGPAQLNVCFEEPDRALVEEIDPVDPPATLTRYSSPLVVEDKQQAELTHFLQQTSHPLVIVSTLKPESKDSIVDFLIQLNAPVYAEGISGLREDPRLNHLLIHCSERLWPRSRANNYPIDGILRIGGVPTLRLWRDLEEKEKTIPVCSINDVPFSGLSRSGVICTSLSEFFATYSVKKKFTLPEKWLSLEKSYQSNLNSLLEELPKSESGLIYHLSKKIQKDSLVYLGNSLPIREWDLAAERNYKNLQVFASRGVNGIDGQTSTFLGLSSSQVDNWALLGDLTALYDMAAPWILTELQDRKINIVVINNGGGKIFSRMYTDPRFCHPHQLQFRPLADMWGLSYQKWEHIPKEIKLSQHNLIEIVPDENETKLFWEKLLLC